MLDPILLNPILLEKLIGLFFETCKASVSSNPNDLEKVMDQVWPHMPSPEAEFVLNSFAPMLSKYELWLQEEFIEEMKKHENH